ncbi:MAG: proprotein convertase P-domain-containing protein [Bacteroidota bacterium]
MFIFIQLCAFGQTFWEKGSSIDDYKGYFHRNLYPIEISALPTEINCKFGLAEVCLNIEHARLSDLKISLMSPDGSNFWLSNRNGGENGKRYTNTCFHSNGFNGFIYQSESPFTGEYIADGLIERFNNGQNPNGFWYLIVEDLKEGAVGEVVDFRITFSAEAVCEEKSICTLEQIQHCACPEENVDCALLPDLVIIPDLTASSIQEFDEQHPDYARQIRFGTGMANIGAGPLEIVGFDQWFCGETPVEGEITCPSGQKSQQRVLQNIYARTGKDLYYVTAVGGTVYYDDKPGHNHYHAEDWVDFLLLKKKWWTKNPKKWKVIGKSEKVSYCLMDSNKCNAFLGNCESNHRKYGKVNLPNFGLGAYAGCNQSVQGISVGGIDYYGTYYEGQFIQLPENTKNGMYYLYLVVDPKNNYQELKEDNNAVLIPIELSKQ